MAENHLNNMKTWSRIGSWAVWNEQDHNDTSPILENPGALRNDVVIVGLNVSAEIPGDWLNYRMGRNDRKLIQLFNKSSYKGAYMTDFIKEQVEVKSNHLLKSLTDEIIQRNVTKFRDEMNALGAGDSTLFILLGNDVKRLFCEELSIYFRNKVSIPHLAARGTDMKFVDDSSQKLTSHYKKTNGWLGSSEYRFYG